MRDYQGSTCWRYFPTPQSLKAAGEQGCEKEGQARGPGEEKITGADLSSLPAHLVCLDRYSMCKYASGNEWHRSCVGMYFALAKYCVVHTYHNIRIWSVTGKVRTWALEGPPARLVLVWVSAADELTDDNNSNSNMPNDVSVGVKPESLLPIGSPRPGCGKLASNVLRNTPGFRVPRRRAKL